MLFDISLDVLEDDILKYNPKLLNLLLSDKTTGNNIIWATDDYAFISDAYRFSNEITVNLITGKGTLLIRPRVAKSTEEQEMRTKDKAEVFTPCWVCNAQNNLVDNEWFGRQGVFNDETDSGWVVNSKKISFDLCGKTWQDYVDDRRLEMACGEAPYIVSRYDTVTGELIPLIERIGILDRKLRVVMENTSSESEWKKWSLRAFQSVYGFEFQGDSLLLARENLLATYIEYYQHQFNRNPGDSDLLSIANTISWNIWQMDGLKCVVPGSCKPQSYEQFSWFETETIEDSCPGCEFGLIHKHIGTYSKIFDWRQKKSLSFVSMIKEGAR